MTEPRFSLGRIVGTPGALHACVEAGVAPVELLRRHVAGDWGELCAADRKENEFSIKHGFRILSAYTLSTGARLYLITEWDRSLTTILLRSEY